MSVGYNPKIVTDGLVLCLDAANSKSYNQAENLISDSEGLSTFSARRVSKTLIASGGPVNNNKYTILTVTDATGGQYLYETSSSVAAGDTVTQNWYVKDVDGLDYFIVKYWTGAGRAWTTTREVLFRLSTGTMTTGGTIVANSITYLANGWYRLSITAVADQAGTAIASFYISNVCPVGNKVYVSGPQLTKKIGPSTYTPTTGTAVTPSTTWKDVSGQGTTGTLTNFPMYGNGAIVFDGVDDYVDFGNPTSVNFGDGSFTIGVWCYRDTNVTTNLRILAKGAGGDTAAEAGFALFGSDNNIYLIVNPSSTKRPSTGAISITPGVPFYVTAIVERNVSMRIYKNGILSSTVAAPVGSFTGTSSLCIGCNTTSAGGRSVYWDGGVYHAHFYNRALSASEIENNFNAMRGRFGL